MKKFLFILIVLIFVFNLFSQDELSEENNIVKVKKGDIIKFDGILISKQKAEKITKDLQELQELRKQKEEYDRIINIFGPALVDEKGTEISIIRTYYESEISKLEKENNKLKIVNKILIVTNSIGWSIAIGEASGIIVGVYINYKF
jgi:hypothetical protein